MSSAWDSEGQEFLPLIPKVRMESHQTNKCTSLGVFGNSLANTQSVPMGLWSRSPAGATTQTLLTFFSTGNLATCYSESCLHPTSTPSPPHPPRGSSRWPQSWRGARGCTGGNSASLLFRGQCTRILKLGGLGWLSSCIRKWAKNYRGQRDILVVYQRTHLLIP